MFDKAIYAHRNVVERCINRRKHRLKQWRGLATRYVETRSQLPRHARPRPDRPLARKVIRQAEPSTCSAVRA